MQEQSEENRIVAKSRPTAMNLTSSVATSSSSVNIPIASRSLGILKASSRQVGLSGRPDASAYQNSNPDAASSGKGMLNCSSAGRICHLSSALGNLQQLDNQGYPENPEVPEDSEDSVPYITRLCTSHGESLLDRKKDL